MTPDELERAGRELAEACGFPVRAYGYSNEGGVPYSWSQLQYLATDAQRILDDCTPVLDAKFGVGGWMLGTTSGSNWAGASLIVAHAGPFETSGEDPTLAYALNRAIFAALSAVKS